MRPWKNRYCCKVNVNGAREKKKTPLKSEWIWLCITLEWLAASLQPRTDFTFNSRPWRCYITPRIQVLLAFTERSLILQAQIQQVTCIICKVSGNLKLHQSSSACGTRLFEVWLLLSLLFWLVYTFFISVGPEFRIPPHRKVCLLQFLFLSQCGTFIFTFLSSLVKQFTKKTKFH